MTKASNDQQDNLQAKAFDPLNPKTEWLRAIEALKEHARVVTTTHGPDLWLPAMRNAAGTLSLDREVRDKELIGYLAAANPAGEPIQPGTVIDESLLAKPGGLWGKLLVHGGINLLVSAPKVGKTALVMHLAGCVLRGERECLGVPIENPFDHLIIVGTDMHIQQWMSLLHREQLAKGSQLGDQVTLFAAENPIQLSEEGLQRIKGECEQHSNSLLLIDTLSSSISDLDLDENKSAFARPIIQLRSAIAATSSSITTIVNHHSSKQGYGSSGTSASRGSGALPGACDQTLSLNYFRQGIDGVERNDNRLVLHSEGRGGRQTLMAEMIDTVDGVKWLSHGDASRYRAIDALWAAQEGLTNRQEEAYEHGCNLHAVDRLLNAPELAQHLNISRPKALRVLKQLERKSLLVCIRNLPAEVEGGSLPRGRQSLWYSAVTEDSIMADLNTEDTLNTHLNHKRPGEGVSRCDQGDGTAPEFKEPVERLMPDGSWEGGWLIHDCVNLNAIKIEKLGNPMLRISNMRWEMDLRPAASAFSASAAPGPLEEPQGISEAPKDANENDNPDWICSF